MTINYDKAFTYRAASAAFTPGASPEDVFTITGSATTNVYVMKMGLSTTQTTAGTNPWFIKKRSTANTGGVSVAGTAVPVQSGNPAATATIASYTTTPTGVGAIVGAVWNGWIDSAKIDTAGIGGLEGVEVNFESMLGQPIALLSTAEVLSWSFNAGALPTGLSVLAWVMWAEQSKT